MAVCCNNSQQGIVENRRQVNWNPMFRAFLLKFHQAVKFVNLTINWKACCSSSSNVGHYSPECKLESDSGRLGFRPVVSFFPLVVVLFIRHF